MKNILKLLQTGFLLTIFSIVLAPLQLPAAESQQSFLPLNAVPSWVETGWMEYRNLYGTGRFDEAEEVRRRVRTKGMRKGIHRFDLLSATLIEEGEKALLEGDKETALKLGLEAELWSPKNPNPAFFIARVLFYESPFFPFKSIGYYFSGLSLALNDFWFSFYFLGRLGLLLVGGLAGSAIFYVVFLVFRYHSLLVHNLQEKQILNLPAAWMGVGVLPLFPLAFGAGLGYSFLILIGMLWFYMKMNERIVSGIFIAMLGLIPLWGGPVVSWLEAVKSSELLLLGDMTSGRASLPGSSLVVKEEGNYKNDSLVLFALALEEKRAGHYRKALELYHRSVQIQPDQPIIHNNIGNVHFLMGQFDQSIKAYERAQVIDSQNVASLYNLSIVYRELFRFEEAQLQYNKAQEINLKLTQSYAKRGGAVIDTVFTNKLLWKRLFESDRRGEEYSERFFGGLFSPLTYKSFPLVLAGFPTVMALLWFIFSARYVASHCSLCAKPICYRCQRRRFDLRICHNCWTTSKNIQRKSDLRQIRIMGTRNYRIGRLLSMIFPGSGQLFLGRMFTGTIYLSVFMGILFGLLFQSTMLLVPGEYWTFLGAGSGLGIFVCLPVVYILSFRNIEKIAFR